ncbi:hypothetical protein VL20_3494 [Microcystis panniformis FACHB-1757]|uniref:Uncharacterized protein n=1 Tax=Microcystis panniformis FACHB-1757 TaxID=1638788 RepID=A0A0K1S2X6_9CHRO|nr:hypothetical protein VL20_3494 [Microcystis panniformis FACHB-1757]
MVAKERKFHAVRLLHSRNQLGRQPLHDSGKGLAIPAVKLLYIRVPEALTNVYQTALYR